MANATIQSNVTIANGCIISTGAIINHDANVGDYCHINSGGIVCSSAKVVLRYKLDYGNVYSR